MSRNARRREPYVPGKERLEVSQEHMTLRLLGLGAALLVAALAFGYAINNMLQAPAGWQTVEAGSSKTGITQYFTLNYNFGAAGGNATKERKAVSAIYTQSLDHAYRVLSSREDAQDAGLAALNASPNREITVDPLLYAALRTVEESGTRQLYFAPLREQYNSLFTADTDEAAEEWDPPWPIAMRGRSGLLNRNCRSGSTSVSSACSRYLRVSFSNSLISGFPPRAFGFCGMFLFTVMLIKN